MVSVPTRAAEVETVAARAAGAAWTALAEMIMSPLAPILIADAEGLGDLVRGLAFEVTEQQGVAVGLAQGAERGVEMRRDLFPGGVRFGAFIHGGGLLFAHASPDVGTDSVGGNILRGAMEPPGEHGPVCEPGGVLRQGHEHGLGDVLREVRVANHPQRSGVDQVDVPPREFGKGGLGPLSGVITQEVAIGRAVHSQNSNRRRKNRTGKADREFNVKAGT
jgi:hypothetical protein